MVVVRLELVLDRFIYQFQDLIEVVFGHGSYFVFVAALLALIVDDVFPAALSYFRGYRLHGAAAGCLAVAGVDINVFRPEAFCAMVVVSRSDILGPAFFADKIFHPFLKSLGFHNDQLNNIRTGVFINQMTGNCTNRPIGIYFNIICRISSRPSPAYI